MASAASTNSEPVRSGNSAIETVASAASVPSGPPSSERSR